MLIIGQFDSEEKIKNFMLNRAWLLKSILDPLMPVVKDEQFVRPIIPTRP